jgi:hypothetical protein
LPVGFGSHGLRHLAALDHARGWLGARSGHRDLKDRRASNRDRLARRSEVQRAALLALQDKLLETFKLAARAAGSGLGPDERTELRHATAEGRVLASRVEDDDVWKEATAFLRVAARLARPNTDDMTDEEARRATDLYTDAADLIAKLLRERY